MDGDPLEAQFGKTPERICIATAAFEEPVGVGSHLCDAPQ